MQITTENLANYITYIFNSDYIMQLIQDSNNKWELSNQYMQLSKFIFSYAMATNDLSKESVNLILDDYLNHKSEITNEDPHYGEMTSEEKYFNNYIFPIIKKRYIQIHNISNKLTLNDYVNIYKEMVINSHKNRFSTHSFPGALFNDISSIGLDIDNEKFKTEISYLSQFGFRTPYQTGRLYLTDLSYQTIGYALNTPEKIQIAFKRLTDLTEEENETTFEYHNRDIDQFVLEHFSIDGIENAKEILKRINDFYYSNPNSCIAIVKNENISTDDIYIPSMFNYTLSSTYLFENLLREDDTFKRLYEKTAELLESNSPEGIELLDSLLNYMNIKYPNNEETKILHKKIEYEIINSITSYGLNSFSYANGEGFSVESGKISTEMFSIATIINPMSKYSEYKKTQNTEEIKNTI